MFHLSNPQTFGILHFPPASTGHWPLALLCASKERIASGFCFTAASTTSTSSRSCGEANCNNNLENPVGIRWLFVVEVANRWIWGPVAWKKPKGGWDHCAKIFSDDFRSFCKTHEKNHQVSGFRRFRGIWSNNSKGCLAPEPPVEI